MLMNGNFSLGAKYTQEIVISIWHFPREVPLTQVNNLKELVQWSTLDLLWTEKGVVRTSNEQVSPIVQLFKQSDAHGVF